MRANLIVRLMSRLILVLVLLGIAACGSGKSPSPDPNIINNNQADTNPTDPNDVPVGLSVSATVSPQQPIVTLTGVGKVTFSQGDAALNPIVTVKKSQDADTSRVLADVQAELEVNTASGYEILITTTVAPDAGVLVEAMVSDSLAAKVSKGNALGLYYQVPGDDDQPSGFIPVASTYDKSTKSVSAALPSLALKDLRNGTFQATIKLAVASAYSETTANTNQLQKSIQAVAPPSGELVKGNVRPVLACPLKASSEEPSDLLGCIEVSRVGFREKEDGSIGDHRGMDLRAPEPRNVYAALGGTVTGYQPEWGKIVIRGDNQVILTYTHLSKVEENYKVIGTKVEAGALIGISGNETPPGISVANHLHFEMLYPSVRNCLKDEFGIECVLVQYQTDPFPYLLHKLQIKRKSPEANIPKDGTFELIVKGYDVNDTPVTSHINVNAGFPKGTERHVIWGSTPSNTLAITAGKTPELFDIATIQVTQDTSAILTAFWDGTNGIPTAEYVLGESVPVIQVFQASSICAGRRATCK